MKFHSKCETDVQREARKVLRQAVRGLRELSSIKDLGALSETQRMSVISGSRTFERIIQAFDDARDDADLVHAMQLGAVLTEHLTRAAATEISRGQPT